MLSEEKKIKEVLEFLLESYGDRLATGELQRLFLERQQRHGESVRDYAVDIERRFLRLTRHDGKLYSCPDTTLAEQFIEGLGDSYIRNTCRDRFEQGTMKAFRELREYAIKREGREEARDKTKAPSDIFNSAVRLGDSNVPRSEDLLQVFREMSDRVVEAVRQVARPSQSFGTRDHYSGQPPRAGNCYNCNSPGHFVRECPLRRRPPRQRFGQSETYNPSHQREQSETYYPSHQREQSETYYPSHQRASSLQPAQAGDLRQAEQHTTPQRSLGPSTPQGPNPVTSHTSEVGVASTSAGMNEEFISKAVGECFSVVVTFCDVPVRCLLDPGSQVTTVSERFFRNVLEPRGFKLQDIPKPFTLVSANGAAIPYIGCFETDMCAANQAIEARVVLVIRVEHSTLSSAGRGNVQGILGMNVLRRCWEELMSLEGHSFMTKIDWPSPDVVWQKALKTVDQKMTFGTESGEIGKAYLGGGSLVISARQAVVIEGRSHSGPTGDSYEAVLEPTTKTGVFPSGVSLAPSLVKVDDGRFPVTVFNESNAEVVIPKSAHLGTLFLCSPVCDGEPDLSTANNLQDVGINKVTVDSQADQILANVDIDETLLDPEQVTKIKALLEKHQNVLSSHERDFGFTDTITHRIDTGLSHPIRQRHRPLPPAQYQAVREHIKNLLEEGIVRESKSPWASPVVVVQKKDSSIRLCVDYRQLNRITHRDSFPLPRIEESLQALGGAQFFSVLDLTSGYYQVAMHQEDVEKTAFVVPFGLYEFTRLPIGLSNAPATFQRLMQQCLGDQCFDNVLIYLDDIIVYAADFDSHLIHLDRVFSRLGQHGLKLKPVKCHLLKREVKYLGHLVSSKGVAVDPEKVRTVRDWPEPTTVRNVRAFLGFTGFFRRFIKGYASIAEPLFKYLRCDTVKKKQKRSQNVPVLLDSGGKAAFNTLIDCLTRAPVLSYADFSKPFRVETDACGTGLGAVLFQLDDDGKHRVVAYASRALRQTERNGHYSAFKLELLAIKWAVTEVFKDYLLGHRCTVITDHHPLTYLDKANLNCHEMRWVQQLSSFDFELIYRPGKNNQVPDILSRRDGPIVQADSSLAGVDKQPDDVDTPPATATTVTSSALTTCLEHHTPGADLPVSFCRHIEACRLGGTSCLPGHTTEQLRELQQKDEVLLKVAMFVERGDKPNSDERAKCSREVLAILRDWKRLSLKDGLLHRKVTSPSDHQIHFQLVLPLTLQKEAFTSYHDDAGHFGAKRTFQLLWPRFFWHNMEATVTEWCAVCKRCALSKPPVRKTRPALGTLSASAPMQTLAMDYTVLEPSTDGYENVLVVTDIFTKYVWAIPTKDQKASTVARALVKNVFLQFGCPLRLHSDCGRNFESKVIEELCELYGVQRSHTTPYHPAGNGQCERFNRTMHNMLASLPDKKKKRWTANTCVCLQWLDPFNNWC